MKVKALVSFSGTFSMYKGEIKECSDKAILLDLLQAGYIEEIKSERPKKDVKSSESKRNNK
ncbi:hypothetical protein SAMN05446037_100161 [Anaerovirgula multivorans]|uniref:Uncharacterized protein n=1 Tax=Anaerovirgula multivorans TaxID=312168 RepID=A0A238ZRB5_9FIRM|nr:hypothetical protein [Anaerovirgula multivorans]SNR85947.1 hypothetical protein SAMN05446037_100161 [Anaerovirgula multivorans]